MTAASFDVLLDDALNLPVELRSKMATRLLASLDQDDTELSAGWKEEIRRRAEAARNGTARRVPHDEVIAGARDLISKLRDSGA
jgi:putative addiction module component (TIGR02574 family)